MLNNNKHRRGLSTRILCIFRCLSLSWTAFFDKKAGGICWYPLLELLFLDAAYFFGVGGTGGTLDSTVIPIFTSSPKTPVLSGQLVIP